MTMDTDRRIARLARLNARIATEADAAKLEKVWDERDELIAELLTELSALSADEQDAWVRWNEKLLARDAKVKDLLDANISASAVAYAIKADRTWVYTIRRTYADRLAKWRAKQG